MHENRKGEIFNQFGDRIFPTSKHDEVVNFILKDYLEHPEKRCCNGGLLHRMILIQDSIDIGTGECIEVRICYDCGKTACFGIKRINQYKEI